jgi:rhodanese-related sulfurtransferase
MLAAEIQMRQVRSTFAEAVRLVAVASLGAGAIALVRGVPTPTPPTDASAVACQAPGDAASDDILFITQGRARELAQAPGVAFVDCRSQDEFAAGHVSGSLHVEPAASAAPEPLVAALSGASTVITYCDAAQQCERSLRVASMLRSAGVPDVHVLEGGLPAWIAHGYPAESGACGHCEGAR